MTTTDLKPGDIVQHPKKGSGIVRRNGMTHDIYIAHDVYDVDYEPLEGWERVETVRPGHVQVRVDDLDLEGWGGEEPAEWPTSSRLAVRAANALAAQCAESTPPADEQDARWSLPADMGDKLAATIKAKIDETFTDRDDANASGEATYECPWCSTIVTFSLSLNRNPRGGVMAWVAADGAHTCPPAQPDEPTDFGARVSVTRPDGSVEKWLRAESTARKPWISEVASGERSWNQVKQRGTVTLGWDE